MHLRNLPTRTLALLCAVTALLLVGPVCAQDPPAGSEPRVLRFADFFESAKNGRGLALTATLREADGQRVRLTGYMVQQEQPARGRFMLTPRPVRMSEHADGDADDLPAAWAMVALDASQQDFVIPYQRGLMELGGVLHVGRLEAQDGRVSWVRLQLDADATRGMNVMEVANYLHSRTHLH